MLIESLIKRKGGTTIAMQMLGKRGKISYHFKPVDPDNVDSPHLCEVTDKHHIQKFLSITEGFMIAGAYEELQNEEVEEEIEPEETEGFIKADKMTNYELEAWAKLRNIAHLNTQSIEDYQVKTLGGDKVDRRKRPFTLLRDLVELEQNQMTEPVEGGS